MLPTAGTQVFHIPELLSIILSHLPQLDKLVYRQVCTGWQNLLDTILRVEENTQLRKTKVYDGSIYSDLNPVLLKHYPGWGDFPLNMYQEHRAQRLVQFCHERQPAASFAGATWRRMFVSEPPCRSIKFVRPMDIEEWDIDHDEACDSEATDFEGDGRKRFRILNKCGVRMQQLVDEVERAFQDPAYEHKDRRIVLLQPDVPIHRPRPSVVREPLSTK
ncbi:MAG: hypothetical protein Q9167_007658 [Letrouitia subvulpina]